ncbi:DUF2177 family protein [Pollutibacter soli]|uniref:DUF2177 family protein n=1 Tax=Pollutibacter soli TaxID=3034157 RepID=UPI0030137A46
MKLKNFLICWLPSFVLMFAINGLFHGKIASDFFDRQFAPIQSVIHPSEYTNMFWVVLLELILSFGMVYFIIETQTSMISVGRAAFRGALINLISASSWNFANASMFIRWSDTLTIVDVTWHVALGAAAGYLIAVIFNRFGHLI